MSEPLIDDDRAFEFLNALQEEYSLYKQLLKCSTQQEKLIAKGKEKELFELMEKKQGIIQKIEALGQQYKQDRKALQESKLGTFSSIDEQFDQVLIEIENTLNKLIENESKDVEGLKTFLDGNNDKVKQLGQGKHLAKAYLKPKNGPSMNKQV